MQQTIYACCLLHTKQAFIFHARTIHARKARTITAELPASIVSTAERPNSQHDLHQNSSRLCINKTARSNCTMELQYNSQLLTSRNLAVLCTTEGWPELRTSIINVLAVGRCRMRRSSVREPQLMVMPARCPTQHGTTLVAFISKPCR